MSSPFRNFSHPSQSQNYFFDDSQQQQSTPSIQHSSIPWKNDEDYDLCNIYCHYTNDSVRGNEQSGDMFWKKVMNTFNQKHPENTRSLSAIQGRFGRINRQTQFYESQIYKIKQANPSGMGGEEHLKRMANEEFIKLFARENGTKKPHYYQFPNCYELLTSTPKWNSDNAKSLRDVQTKGKGKGKNKASKSSYSSSPGDSSSREYNVEGENEMDALNQRPDEDYRPMGVKAAKRKNKVDSVVNAKVNAAHEIHKRRHLDRTKIAQEKVDVMRKFADIEQQKLDLERETQEQMIMDKDLTGMDEFQKQYWMECKKQILISKFPHIS